MQRKMRLPEVIIAGPSLSRDITGRGRPGDRATADAQPLETDLLDTATGVAVDMSRWMTSTGSAATTRANGPGAEGTRAGSPRSASRAWGLLCDALRPGEVLQVAWSGLTTGGPNRRKPHRRVKRLLRQQVRISWVAEGAGVI